MLEIDYYYDPFVGAREMARDFARQKAEKIPQKEEWIKEQACSHYLSPEWYEQWVVQRVYVPLKAQERTKRPMFLTQEEVSAMRELVMGQRNRVALDTQPTTIFGKKLQQIKDLFQKPFRRKPDSSSFEL